MKIASKLRVLVVGLALLPAIAAAYLVYQSSSETTEHLQVETLEGRAKLEAKRLEVAFEEIEHDIELLAALPILRQIAAFAEAGDLPRRELEQLKDELASVFGVMLSAKPHYDQIRLIGVAEGGREVVRLHRQGGAVERVAEAQLQRKGFRPYFQEAIQKGGSEPYYSRVNLNWEWNRIEEPHRPMLRLAVPVRQADGDIFGIVIINLDFKGFVRNLFPDRPNRYRYYLTNAEGYYLMHPDPAQTFGFDLGRDTLVQREFPELEAFFADTEGSITFREDALFEASGGLVHFRVSTPLEPSRKFGFGIAASYEDVGVATAQLGRDTALFLLAVLLGGIALALWAAQHLIRPLRQVTAAAEWLPNGGADAALPTDRADEIGALARSFASMRTVVRAREEALEASNRELDALNRDLEHFNQLASHELREPLRRMAATVRILESDLGHLTEEQGQLLHHLMEESERALGQIEDFRLFSKLGSGSLRREPVMLDELVDEVAQRLGAQDPARRLDVKHRNLPVVLANRSLLDVLLTHVVRNAMELPDPPHVRMVIEASPVSTASSSRYTISLHAGDDVAHAEAEINGRRAGAPQVSSRPQTFTGMDVALCRRIAEVHGDTFQLQPLESGFLVRFSLERAASL